MTMPDMRDLKFLIETYLETVGVKDELPVEEPVREAVQEVPSILVETTDDEYCAAWDETPPMTDLRKLVEDIEARPEFGFYRLGETMMFASKAQAVAAVKSLLRG